MVAFIVCRADPRPPAKVTPAHLPLTAFGLLKAVPALPPQTRPRNA